MRDAEQRACSPRRRPVRARLLDDRLEGGAQRRRRGQRRPMRQEHLRDQRFDLGRIDLLGALQADAANLFAKTLQQLLWVLQAGAIQEEERHPFRITGNRDEGLRRFFNRADATNKRVAFVEDQLVAAGKKLPLAAASVFQLRLDLRRIFPEKAGAPCIHFGRAHGTFGLRRSHDPAGGAEHQA